LPRAPNCCDMVSSVDALAATGLENRNVRFGSKADMTT
jgi:hypothetical protein